MNPLLDDTIAALASAPGPSVRGIIRISGPGVVQTLNAIFTPDDADLWRDFRLPRRHRGSIAISDLRSPLPADVHLWPNARSYTGQPSAELHTVGSPPLLEALLAELYRRGARPARAGEFTLRAFLAGRIDLVQAEAVLGVIDSVDHTALEAALRQLAGGISSRIRAVHEDLVDLLADLEAGLDFVEEDIEFVSRDEITRRLVTAQSIVDELRNRSTDRMVSNTRVRIVLAGLPNAGKSTLFNALVGREDALVSAVSGTTRDYLRAELDWDRLPVELVDTAGWEQAAEGIGTLAQQLRDEQVQRADIVLWCTAADSSNCDRLVDERLHEQLRQSQPTVLRIGTKRDLSPDAGNSNHGIDVSAKTRSGLSALIQHVRGIVTDRSTDADSLLGSTAARCRDSLRIAAEATSRALAVARSELGDELVAAELREAIDGLGEIVGTVYTDDLLGRIFSKFCIGK